MCMINNNTFKINIGALRIKNKIIKKKYSEVSIIIIYII